MNLSTALRFAKFAFVLHLGALLWRKFLQYWPALLALFWAGAFAAALLSPSRYALSVLFVGGNYLTTAYLVMAIAYWPRALMDWRHWPLLLFGALGLASVYYGAGDADFIDDKILPEFYYTAMFMVQTAIVFGRDGLRERLLAFMAWTGLGAIVFNLSHTLTLFYLQGSHIPFDPLGQINNTVMAGLVFAVIALILLDKACREGRWWWTIGYALAVLLVVIDQSRVALLALTLASLVRIALARLGVRRTAQLLIGLVGALLIAALFIMPDGFFQHWLDKGFNNRIEIWDATMAQIPNAPLFGHGLGADFKTAVIDYAHPHNLVLALLYFLGAAGLVLFAAILVTAFRGALYSTAPEKALALSLLAFFIVATLVESGKFIDGAGGYPLYFWFPILLVYAIMSSTRKVLP